MKNENYEMMVKMMKVEEGNWFPLVEVEYMDQEANEHTALMIVDSCCCHNILIGSRAERHRAVLHKEVGSMDIIAAANEMITTRLAKFHFVLGGEQFHESFCIKEDEIQIQSEIKGKPIIGILGNLFMQQYRLAIDYSDYTLHTSNYSREKLPISACDFFFPMEIGLERYDLPVLTVRQNGKDLVALADTGATGNMIAMQSITDNGFDCRFLDSTDTVVGLAGETEVKNAIMKFSLLTLTESETDVVHHEDVFKVAPNYMITPEEGQCDKNGEQLPPVVGIIGSPFMAKEGWVLDFGSKYIYKKKAPKVVDMNIRVNISAKRYRKQIKSEKCGSMSKRRIRFFVDATKTGLPFIQVKEGDFKGIIMLIDTGSNDNIMFGYAFHQLKDYMTLTEMKSNLYGIEGNPTTSNFADGTLCFCGKEYEMKFVVNENNKIVIHLSQEMGFPIAGIIGTKFLIEHEWMIDFGKQEIIIPAYDATTEDLKNIRNRNKVI